MDSGEVVLTKLPDSPAGAQASWFLERFGKMLRGRDIKERFAPSFLTAVSPLKVRAVTLSLKAHVPVTVEEVVGDELNLQVSLVGSKGPLNLQISVESDEPHLIQGLVVRPAGPTVTDALRTATPRRDVTALLEETLGSYAKSLRGKRSGLAAAARFEGEVTVSVFGAASADSIFEIGSITKPMTASLLAEMAQSGEVALDDPVDRYLPAGVSLPQLGPRESPITLFELATHTAGLPRLPVNLDVPDENDPYKTFTIDSLFSGLSATQLENRGVVAYSNLGYALLGNVLARAADTSYGRLLSERVLAPLGMIDSRVGPDASLEGRRVPGHRGGKVVPYWTRTAVAPSGGVESTVGDVLAFAGAHAAAEEGSALAATHVRRFPRPNETYMGLSWIIVDTEYGDVLWHNGGTGGFRSFVGFHKESSTAVTVLTNTSDGAEPDAIAAAVLGSLACSAQDR